ncbi:MAG TPA: amino acid ABC transporter permease [Phycicoccus elongatus]|jgi:glutamate transport system permease protein|uniref:Putative Glutamate transport system permease protein gluC n=1 Tax=Phycicoccus elongatus Lp2 TaxID=1193181 RepID=N0E379_9MICO|nr:MULTISPECIES: amino acid ABC transporter permease [Phycicoccus]MBK8728131.1 amino acid ABC transporter permease [Tetrasphaera sp.]MCA0323429.1 amino acid ABC transporter permease [Actinomycetota bacterium]MCB1239694.1 amino acid ABC transporter permease [Tetrasphaera sp.]MCB9405257.1 amino acid ABC transporter permease [Tetrasphaera sp.]MCO5303648.1 amino acid ABC transporter permease [Phycicoccus sp.]
MGELLKNYDVWGAIWTTIQLAVLSAIGATVIGTIVAIMRVSPVAVLRGLGTSYVNIFRNTPLTVLLVMSVLGLAFILGLSFSDDFARNAYWWAVAMLSLYHAAFICEALRSGINTVPAGQAEAARSIGLTFSQSLSQVLLPQAFRGAVAPLVSTYIALIKNTTVAAVIGVTDIAGLLQEITENEGAQLGIFFMVAMVFVVLTLPLGVFGTSLSRRLAVKR